MGGGGKWESRLLRSVGGEQLLLPIWPDSASAGSETGNYAQALPLARDPPVNAVGAVGFEASSA